MMFDPFPQASFLTGQQTHVGHVRAQNEDSLLARPEIGLWAVADGMGGHESGAYASATAMRALEAVAPDEDVEQLLWQCSDRVMAANVEIMDFSDRNGGGTVGTTVAVLVCAAGRFACLWCGDSRIYRIRHGAIEQVSRDHTEVQELVDHGVITREEARTWPGRNVLTRAIGVLDDPRPDVARGELHPNDLFVLCSDGLTGHVEDKEILAIAGRRTPESGCAELIDLALSRGGKDNVTVVVVQYRPDATRRMVGPLNLEQA